MADYLEMMEKCADTIDVLLELKDEDEIYNDKKKLSRVVAAADHLYWLIEELRNR